MNVVTRLSLECFVKKAFIIVEKLFLIDKKIQLNISMGTNSDILAGEKAAAIVGICYCNASLHMVRSLQ